MRTSRFSEEQIIGILREAELKAKTIGELCREKGISEVTFYKWRQKYGGLQIQEVQRIRVVESENARLKRLVAEQALALDVMKEINSKNWVGHK